MYIYERFICILVVIFVAGCASHPKPVEPSAKWINNMHRLSHAYLELMPFVTDPNDFASAANRDFIRANLHELNAAASEVAHDPVPPNADPIIGYTATRFAVEMRQAANAFDLQDAQWARYAVSRASDYCVNCHTSVNLGAKDFPIAWQLQLAKLPPAQKIESLLATRQYASALNLANSFVWSKTAAQNRTRFYEQTIERVMAMLVRVNQDKDDALQLAASVMNNSAAPFFVRNDAAAWYADIAAWKSEKPVRGAEAKFRLAKSLVKKSASRPHMEANLIPSLRASGLLHEILRSEGPRRAGVLFQAGLVAQSLREINLGFLDQYYFESCIRAEPHTPLAEECYVQLDTSVHDNSLLMDMEPASAFSIESRMTELRQLAEVPETDGPPGWRARVWDYDIDENGQPQKKRSQ